MTYIPIPTGLAWLLLVLVVYILAQFVLSTIRHR